MDDKPCPFCMSDDLSFLEGYGPQNGDFVVCDECFAEGPKAPTDEQAHAAWNRRSGQEDECPFCAASDRDMVGFDEIASQCRNCGASGPRAPDEVVAGELWCTRGARQ